MPSSDGGSVSSGCKKECSSESHLKEGLVVGGGEKRTKVVF